MKKVSFVATRPHKFKIGAWVIMKVMRTDYSHVAIVFHGKHERKYPYEANGHSGVNFVGHAIWSSRNQVVAEFPYEFQEEHFDDILDCAMGMCGTDYAFWQNIGIKLCDWLRCKQNPFTTGKNCSELVKEIGAKMGVMFSEDDDRITPRQAIDYLRAKHGG